VLSIVIGTHKAASYTQVEEQKSQYLQVNYNEIQTYARLKVFTHFGTDQWIYFNDLVVRESNWDYLAQNPTSSAFGLGQFLDSTWYSVGYGKTSDPYIQIDAMVDYIEIMYGTPQQAISHHNRVNWY